MGDFPLALRGARARIGDAVSDRARDVGGAARAWVAARRQHRQAAVRDDGDPGAFRADALLRQRGGGGRRLRGDEAERAAAEGMRGADGRSPAVVARLDGRRQLDGHGVRDERGRQGGVLHVRVRPGGRHARDGAHQPDERAAALPEGRGLSAGIAGTDPKKRRADCSRRAKYDTLPTKMLLASSRYRGRLSVYVR